jgi:protein-tyrosine phosphatase
VPGLIAEPRVPQALVHTVPVTGAQQQTEAFAVLFVCTGNICRSALAERLGRAYLDDRLGDEAGCIRLASAGVGAVVGSGMHPDSALVLTGFGGDPGGFVARQVDERAVADADLVLTMTRQHRRAVLQMAPRALNKTFTLREAADVAAHLDGDVLGEDFAERARDVVRQLATLRSRRSHEDDDVPDPIDQPLEVHQQAGELIAESLIPLLDRLSELRGEAAEPTRCSPAAEG